MLTTKEVADQLRLSARKVYALASSGHLASHRFGAAVRFSQADVDAYVQASRRPLWTERAGSLFPASTMSAPKEHKLSAYFSKKRALSRNGPD